MTTPIQAAGASISTDIVRQVPQANSQVASVSDGADQENDGDSDDVGTTTASRGNHVNISA